MSSFFRDISLSCPSNANLARYRSTSGLLGGGAILRGGAGGALDLATAVGVELDGEMTKGFGGVVTADLTPDVGRGCAAGLRAPDFFCNKNC